MEKINDLIADLEAKLLAEEIRIHDLIARTAVEHGSMSDGYWKDLYKIKEALRAARKVREALDDITS